MCWMVYVIMVVAGVLAPIWCQDTSNHHADSAMSMVLCESYHAVYIACVDIIQAINAGYWDVGNASVYLIMDRFVL